MKPPTSPSLVTEVDAWKWLFEVEKHGMNELNGIDMRRFRSCCAFLLYLGIVAYWILPQSTLLRIALGSFNYLIKVGPRYGQVLSNVRYQAPCRLRKSSTHL